MSSLRVRRADGKTAEIDLNGESEEAVRAWASENGYEIESGEAPPQEAAPEPAPEPEPEQPKPGSEYNALETAGDVAASAAVAIPRGIINSTVGLPGNIESLIRMGVGAGQNFLGTPAEDQVWNHDTLLPTGQDIESGIESVTGEWYDPKTAAGSAMDFGVQAFAAPVGVGLLGKGAQLAKGALSQGGRQAAQSAAAMAAPRGGAIGAQAAKGAALREAGRGNNLIDSVADVSMWQRGYDGAKLGTAVGGGAFAGGQVAEGLGFDRQLGEVAGAVLAPGVASAHRFLRRDKVGKTRPSAERQRDLDTLTKDPETPPRYRVNEKNLRPSSASDDLKYDAQESQIVSGGGPSRQGIVDAAETGFKENTLGLMFHASRKDKVTKGIINKYQSGKITARQAIEDLMDDTGKQLDKFEGASVSLEAGDLADIRRVADEALTKGGVDKFRALRELADALEEFGGELPQPVWNARRTKLLELARKSKDNHHRAAARQIIDTIQKRIKDNMSPEDAKAYDAMRLNWRRQSRMLDEQNAAGANRDYVHPGRLQKIVEGHDTAGYQVNKYDNPFDRRVEAGSKVLNDPRAGKVDEEPFIKELGVILGSSSAGASVGAAVGAPLAGGLIGGAAGAAYRASQAGNKGPRYLNNMQRVANPRTQANRVLQRVQEWLGKDKRQGGKVGLSKASVNRWITEHIPKAIYDKIGLGNRAKRDRLADLILNGQLPEEEVNWLLSVGATSGEVDRNLGLQGETKYYFDENGNPIKFDEDGNVIR